MEHLEGGEWTLPSWEHLQTFLAAAEGGSFRAVQSSMGLAPNTVRRHIKALEDSLNVVLFLRNPNGIELTGDGRKLFEVAKRMEQSCLSIKRKIEPNVDKLKGQVWISITEGLGTVWLMPHVVKLQKQYRDLRFRIDCQMDAADLVANEADMCVQLDMPEAQDLMVVKVGKLNVMPYASKEYLDMNGRPKSLDDCLNHKFVLQEAAQMHAMQFVEEIADPLLLARNTSIACNTSTAHYWAISKGGGIGMLPTYVSMLSDNIEPVDLGPRTKMQRDIWLAFHPDLQKVKRIDKTIGWIKTIFDGKRYPWFSDSFIDPGDLHEHITDEDVKEEFGDMLVG